MSFDQVFAKSSGMSGAAAGASQHDARAYAPASFD
jgi:hypothetical protein